MECYSHDALLVYTFFCTVVYVCCLLMDEQMFESSWAIFPLRVADGGGRARRAPPHCLLMDEQMFESSWAIFPLRDTQKHIRLPYLYITDTVVLPREKCVLQVNLRIVPFLTVQSTKCKFTNLLNISVILCPVQKKINTILAGSKFAALIPCS